MASSTTTIDPASNWGTWEGFGTSLAWWAKVFGERDDIADALFTLGWPSLNGHKVAGLGLTIARYNAGASSWDKVGDAAMVVSPKMMPTRQMEGFLLDWMNGDPQSSSWNWNLDAGQRAMLGKAKARGANRFELFSNSPMWWMCQNRNPSGANDGGDNLTSWNIKQHAVYLATIARHAADNWGINFESVEPCNEPMGTWWKGNEGTSEGCHIGTGMQAPLINALRTELNARGLSQTMVSASDENSYSQARDTWLALGNSTRSNIGRVNVHGYEENGPRDQLYNEVSTRGHKLWNSEYGENDASGARLAANLILDFRWLHPRAWVYWQALDWAGWGLIDASLQDGAIGEPSQKYFVLAQFSRHIRPGMRILDGGSDYTVAAYDEGRKKLVIVAVNWSDSGMYINFELGKFKKPSTDGGKVLRWVTKIGDASGVRYKDFAGDTKVKGTKFWSWFDPKTLQTFEVDDVLL